MEVELKKRRKVVKQADNDVLNGIRTMANFISQGDFVVCRQCEHLIKEMETYSWDSKKVKIGEDAPIKSNDHAVDATRYALYTHFGERKIIKTTQTHKPQNLMDRPGFGDGRGWQQMGGGQPPLPRR
jgi:phage terminase large subunit